MTAIKDRALWKSNDPPERTSDQCQPPIRARRASHWQRDIKKGTVYHHCRCECWTLYDQPVKHVEQIGVMSGPLPVGGCERLKVIADNCCVTAHRDGSSSGSGLLGVTHRPQCQRDFLREPHVIWVCEHHPRSSGVEENSVVVPDHAKVGLAGIIENHHLVPQSPLPLLKCDRSLVLRGIVSGDDPPAGEILAKDGFNESVDPCGAIVSRNRNVDCNTCSHSTLQLWSCKYSQLTKRQRTSTARFMMRAALAWGQSRRVKIGVKVPDNMHVVMRWPWFPEHKNGTLRR